MPKNKDSTGPDSLPADNRGAPRDDLRALFVILTAAAVSWLLVWPLGDFPLNDDWAYASSVRWLLEEGRFVLSDWAAPFDLVPVLSGALLSQIAGFRHETLRACTWLWGVLGVFFFHRLLRMRGVDEKVRWLACAVLALNPIHFLLAFSFHTDVPFLAMALGALYYFEKSEDTGSGVDELRAALFAAGALLTRQSGAVLFLSFILWRTLRRRMSAASFVRLGALPLLGIAFYLWYVQSHPKTWAGVNYLAGGTLLHLSSAGTLLRDVLRWSVDSLLYAGLFCSPFLFLTAPVRKGKSFLRDAVLLAVAAGLCVYVLNRGAFPYLENVFHPRGLGTMTVYEGNRWKPAFLWSAKGLWLAYAVLSAAGLWMFLRRLAAAPWDEGRRRLLFVAGALALSTLAGSRYFDRYVLVWLLMALLLLTSLHARSKVPWPAWTAAGFWAALSLFGTMDYFLWNRAKWELGRAASGFGFAPAEVANGFDWNAHWKYEANMAELKREKPLEKIGEWEWERMDRVRAVISFSPQMLPESNRMEVKTYRSPLSPGGVSLFLFGKEPRSAPRLTTPPPQDRMITHEGNPGKTR